MKRFDVQGVELTADAAQVFAYLANPAHLPDWTHAFASVAGDRAVMRTPAGELAIGLAVTADADRGTVDWVMHMPDGSIATAYSRVVALAPGRCAYSFVLPAPPAPLEQIEGALAEQSRTLTRELANLERIFAGD